MTCRKAINNILQLCDQHFFARPVTSAAASVDYLKLGPVGEILKNNIRNEWFHSNVINTDINVFPFSANKLAIESVTQDFAEPFQYAKELSNSQLPFGLADSWFEQTQVPSELSEETALFHPRQQCFLRTRTFVRPNAATQLFHSLQRQRKIWWRKFSVSPGRFSLTTVQSEDGIQSIDIQAEFPWGQETVETIVLKGASPFDSLNENDRALYEFKDGTKKTVLPHVVESVTSLDRAVLTYLCDAYEDGEFHGQPRKVMNFHRKLAPYKISFAATATKSPLTEEASQLALYLSKQLRKGGVSTLLLADRAKKSLEAQFVRNDEMGVPYTAVINEATLTTGIAGLRSRDTTLKEQVHVTELYNYMEQLLKNY